MFVSNGKLCISPLAPLNRMMIDDDRFPQHVGKGMNTVCIYLI